MPTWLFHIEKFSKGNNSRANNSKANSSTDVATLSLIVPDLIK